MNIGDQVIYTENGNDFIATVLEIRQLEHHSGKNDEPLLHLGFFAQVLKPAANGIPTRVSIVGTHAQYDLAQFRLDVAHETHSFDEKLKLPTYPGGRWKECTVVANPEIFDEDQQEEELTPFGVNESLGLGQGSETQNEEELEKDPKITDITEGIEG